MDDKVLRRSIGRRRLLRRVGTLAAGVAGAGAVTSAIASPAQANAGDNLVLGSATNNAGTAATTLTTNSSTNPALVLSNTATTTDSNNNAVGGPALQLTPSGIYPSGPVGSIGMGTQGTLWYIREGSNGPFADPVRTVANTATTVAFSPVRMLDTRPGQPAVNRILNPSVLDSGGNIMQGQTLQLSLDDLLVFADAVFVNVTLLAGGHLGYITLFPSDQPLPLASNLNFNPGQLVNNFALVALGTVTGATNAFSIFCGFPARIIIDVLGAVVHSPGDIKSIPGFNGLQATGGAHTRVRPPGI
jgi:hypothetical protein